jgi:hypothetical protein
MPRAALATLGAVALLLAASGVGAASTPPNHVQVRLNAADQAAARAAVVRRADLGSTGWSGGAAKPDLTSTISCPGYTPKQSDLVLTGAAEADFRKSALALQSVAQVLKTTTMVARDWQRTVASPKAFACLRTTLTRSLPAGERLVSFRRLPFPRLARYSAAFRAVIDVSVLGRHARVLADIVVAGRSRTELTLSVEAPAAARATVTRAEVRLLRVLLARVRA